MVPAATYDSSSLPLDFTITLVLPTVIYQCADVSFCMGTFGILSER